MEDKNIDRIFQEKLTDMEVQPNPLIWEHIEDKLTKKKKKRIIPLWWFSSGIASVIVVGILIGPSIFKKGKKEVIPIDRNNIEEKVVFDFQKQENKSLTKEIKEEELESESANDRFPPESSLVSSIATASNTAVNKEKEAKEKFVVNNYVAKEKENQPMSGIIVKGYTSDGKIAMKNLKEKDSVSKKTDAKRELTTKKDFLAEVAKEAEEETKKEKFKKKNTQWSISPVVGVLTAKSFNNSSAIDVNLSGNTINGGETFSYGVNVSYQLNKKWTINSGVQMQKIEYNTQNVGLVSGTVASNNLENIRFSGASQNFLYLGSIQDLSTMSLVGGSFTKVEEGDLEQVYSYVEIPLEIKYELFSSSIVKTSIVSGFSTLFLNENKISAKTTRFSEVIGEATNLNSVNFSANLGVDFGINLSKKVKFNITPTFKTQLNTFSGSSTNFSPYTIGIYSGLRFNF